MKLRRLTAVPALVAAVALTLSACSDTSSDDADAAAGSAETTETTETTATTEGTDAGSAESGEFPITIEHALGETVIEDAPERVATVNWANQEVPLALGVVPVGMQEATFGDDDDNGILPWVEEKLEELGGETPVLFDETDGIDFEAVADTDPDVILAAYSGLTQDDYDTLSEIAPVVAYPEAPWATDWRDMITYNAMGLGLQEEGEQLIDDLQSTIDETAAEHPELAGTSTMFMTHVDTTDLSTVNFYTANDTRVAFFEDLGLAIPQSVQDATVDDSFSGTVSAEQVDQFEDVEMIVTYGDQELVDTLKADPLLSQMPAVANDAIVFLDGSGPQGTASNPTPLAIDWVLEDYVTQLGEAAAKSDA